MDKPDGKDRREFLRSLGRLLVGGALALGAAALALRSGPDCPSLGTCRGCRELPGCILPQAVAARGGGRRP